MVTVKAFSVRWACRENGGVMFAAANIGLCADGWFLSLHRVFAGARVAGLR